MTAGLVAYKLCDREYDCDSCPLDQALRGGEGHAVPADIMTADAPRWEFRSDRHYHTSHGWIQQVKPGHCRYGLDVFAGRLLGHASSVVLPTIGSSVSEGRPVCWVVDESEVIPLHAPVTGTVESANQEVQASPSLLATSPYDAGWLLGIHCASDPAEAAGLLSAQEMQNRTESELRMLHEEGLQDMCEDAVVGPTLADGGEPIGDLRRVLGPERFHKLIMRFLL
jgi:glycine cleavage system H protein